MTTIADPLVDNWYKDLENNQLFEVISCNEEQDTIELQYFDGAISGIDRESWYSSTFVPVEPPEDWSAPYGDLEMDDLGYTDNDVHAPNINDIEIEELVSDY